MSSTRPINRNEFKDYILRLLGAGVVDIELTDDQMEDVVNDTLSEFAEYHNDGSRERFLYLKREPEQTKWILPDDVLAVNKVLQGRFSYFFHGGASDVHLMFSNHGNAMFATSPPDGQTLTTYYIMEQHYQEMRQLLIPNVSYDFNFLERVFQLRSSLPPSGSVYQEFDGFLVLEVTSAIDENESPRLWSHRWVRDFAMAKAGHTWAMGISKFDSPMHEGSRVNGEKMLMKYEKRLEDLQQQAFDTGAIPEIFIW